MGNRHFQTRGIGVLPVRRVIGSGTCPYVMCWAGFWLVGQDGLSARLCKASARQLLSVGRWES